MYLALSGLVLVSVVALVLGFRLVHLNRKAKESARRNDELRRAHDALMVRMREGSSDLGRLAETISGYSAQAAQTSEEISSAIEQVAQGASAQTVDIQRSSEEMEALAGAVEDIAGRVQDQTEDINKVASLISEMATAADGAAGETQRVARSASEAAGNARLGGEAISSLLEAMGRTRRTVVATGDKVQGFERISQEITGMIGVIGDIARQTNLLALNAAIEAARTGITSRTQAENVLEMGMISQSHLLAELLCHSTPTVNDIRDLCQRTGIDEVWITDHDGVVVLTNNPDGIGFRFPDDPSAQAAAFRRVLGREQVVVQPAMHRDIDGKMFKYVGVARRDRKGIVQVGIEASNLERLRDHGKGFAVVADEVRKLAERSGDAAKEIATLVNNIRQGASEAAKAVQVSTDEVNRGSQMAEQAGNALQQILGMVTTTDSQTQAIMAAIQQVAAGTRQIERSVQEFARAIKDNAASAAGMKASSARLVSSIQSISAVASENAASAEEVSASVEHQVTAIREVASAAQSLAAGAAQIQQPAK